MLPKQPLRFVLADDPGAGKTIMAGLFIRELIMRADSRRVLVVAPGSLVEQWRDEMFEKFGLEFRVFNKDLEAATPTGNPFEDIDHLIVRLDQLSRDEVGEGAEEKKPGPLQPSYARITNIAQSPWTCSAVMLHLSSVKRKAERHSVVPWDRL